MKLATVYARGLAHHQMLIIESYEDLIEYYQKFRLREVSIANDHIRDKKFSNYNLVGTAVSLSIIKLGKCTEDEPAILVKVLAETIGKAFEDQLRFLSEGKKLAINQKGGYFPLMDGEFFDEVEIKRHKIFKPTL